jgi:hypothetical protein
MKKQLLLLTFVFIGVFAKAQQPADTAALKDVGVAVTPAHINYNLKPGQTQTIEVKVTNETLVKRSFNVSLKDYDADKAGKTIFMEPGTAIYGMSNWLSVSPTFFELKPGAMQKVRVTLAVPDSSYANRAAWGLLWIEEKKERESLDNKPGDKKISLGVIPTFAFGVYLYQNPPSVANNKVEIQNFVVQVGSDKQRKVDMTLKNMGDGIASCTAYVELTNTTTGKTDKLTVKRFTILPGYTRNYMYTLPTKLEKGNYSAVGVLDYGSKDAVEAAELTFKVE